jgi:hypothetical protein
MKTAAVQLALPLIYLAKYGAAECKDSSQIVTIGGGEL